MSHRTCSFNFSASRMADSNCSTTASMVICQPLVEAKGWGTVGKIRFSRSSFENILDKYPSVCLCIWFYLSIHPCENIAFLKSCWIGQSLDMTFIGKMIFKFISRTESPSTPEISGAQPCDNLQQNMKSYRIPESGKANVLQSQLFSRGKLAVKLGGGESTNSQKIGVLLLKKSCSLEKQITLNTFQNFHEH